MFMNRWDIEEAIDRHQSYTVRWKAARVIKHLADQADQVSDGWVYWPKPSRAAAKMAEIARHPGYGPLDATEADYRKALGPIKAFYTKWGNKAGMEPLPGYLL